ncbi:hypothetical protein F5148DRAFT_1148083 [Russula earlei]|uniref:Uncharacterized protein n=1 Tax=Russula earlei TaxID=71964 RepID=A0ACC0UDX9_9AGAM|nr:hypothetical protein F5148DRAFT_1148083 [Russula earlei]
MMRRTTSEDETRRGDDRPTLPPIRDLFGRELSQPPPPSASATPAHYSPSSHFNQLALPDENTFRGEQGRGNYASSHGHTHAAGHAQFRPLTATYHSPQRPQPAGYANPTSSARPFVSFHPELHDTMRPPPAASNRAAYDSTRGPVQFPYHPPPAPPAPPQPLQQSHPSGSTSRAPPTGLPVPATNGPIIFKFQLRHPIRAATRANVVKLPFICGINLPRGLTRLCATAFKCTFEGCDRTFSVQSNMRRHARTHLQSGNEARESEGDEDSDEDSPQPQATAQEQAPPPR